MLHTILLINKLKGKDTSEGLTCTCIIIELNAVRCAAGWVARALRKKLVKSAYLKRGDLQICLWDILDDGDEGQMKTRKI